MDFFKADKKEKQDEYKLLRGGWMDTRGRIRVIVKMGGCVYFDGRPDAVKIFRDGLYIFKSDGKCYSTHVTNVLMIEDYERVGEINES